MATRNSVNQDAVNAAMAACRAEVTEQRTVEIEATLQADAILAHRADIRELRETVRRLSAELHEQNASRDMFEQLFELVQAEAGNEDPTAKAERAAAFKRAMSLAGRTKIARDLVEATRALVTLERQILKIDAESDANSYEAFMQRVRDQMAGDAAGVSA